ncbi:MAG TPA: DUF1963 domain-containing protein [Mucilaginibacter sp.]
MGLFQKLFGSASNKQTVQDSRSALTPEQFLQTAYVKDITAGYCKDATVLNPAKSSQPISATESKFGGRPNLGNFTAYPCCDSCSTPLNFVFQLYRKDFEEHYWPAGKDLFLLFRCPNDYCPQAYSEPFHADRKMFHYYFTAAEGINDYIDLPRQPARENDESPVPDCKLNPERITDYPVYEDFGDVINDIEYKFGESFGDLFIDEFHAVQRTKIGGYPSFTQAPDYPKCKCGKEKEFFFQLSSEDTEPHVTKPGPDDWSPHGIMIGDVGNIYYYVCKGCGEESIESYWDCY